MESIEKYKSHLIKNLANKETKYMPSVSSMSDLSVTGINDKWYNRWKYDVQSGAEIPHENDESENKSQQTGGTSEESNIIGGATSVLENIKEQVLETSHKKFTQKESDEYKPKIIEKHSDYYKEKYNQLKYETENKKEAETLTAQEKAIKEALNGLGFWATYNKFLENLYNKEKGTEQHYQESDCTECCDCCNDDKPMNILLTRSKSGKVVDKLTIGFNQNNINNNSKNKINIAMKSKNSGNTITCNINPSYVDDGVSPLKIEPTFGPKIVGIEEFTTVKPKFLEQSQNNYVEAVDPMGYKSRKLYKEHTPNNNFEVHESKFDQRNVSFEPNAGFENHYGFNETYNQNVYPGGCGYNASNMRANFNQRGCMSPGFGGFDGYGVPGNPTGNYYPEGYADIWPQELVKLLVGDVKLHAFKINNKSVNVPLFLNVGNIHSFYSGQGFVSNTNVGLFKISVVDPIQPKVSLGNKIVNLIGMNNYNNPSCKCTNLDFTKAIKNAVPSPNEVVQWMNPMKIYRQFNSGYNNVNGQTNPSKGYNTQPNEPMVCDFHKNLFSHGVDRTKFGKDVFCQIKYMTGISSDAPIRVTKNNFTTGSNVSTFFNGFYEQLLCLGDSSQMSKYELQNNHKFTFIIRRVKGSKYGKNFVIINTTTGQHLCIDLLTHELKFEEECKFSKYLVPAIFKIISLPTLVDSISKDSFNCFKPVVENYCGYPEPFYNNNINNTYVQSIMRTPTHMSTTDQYVNVS